MTPTTPANADTSAPNDRTREDSKTLPEPGVVIDLDGYERLIAALNAASFQQDSEWHAVRVVYATKPRPLLDDAAAAIRALIERLRALEGGGGEGGTSARSQPCGRASADAEVSAGRNAEEPAASEPDENMRELFSGVAAVVEANGFERMKLWERYSKRVAWRENLSGRGATVGWIGGKSVFISLLTADVAGQKLLFMHPTSVAVDHDMIEAWLLKHLPPTARRDDGRLNIVDADNFHQVAAPLPAPPSEAG